MKDILATYFVWKVLLYIILTFALLIVPLQLNFLGGGLDNYLSNPQFWAYVNFDGEHYLAIAYKGYQDLTYFFFPFYPLLTHIISTIINPNNYRVVANTGLWVSNISIIISLFGLKKLFNIDFEDINFKLFVYLLFVFPTSFFFSAFYTESLFLALTVWAFVFMRKRKWIVAGLLIGLTTATRIVGLALIPAFLYEFYVYLRYSRKNIPSIIIGAILSIAGIMIYMYYLKITTGDSLYFFHNVSIYGQQRSSSIVLLPQVFYRYFFKITPSLNYNYFPVVFVTFFELFCGILSTILVFYTFFKLRMSYALYTLFAFLIPTLAGSFSSLPRYFLVIFPFFVIISKILQNRKKYEVVFIYLIFIICFIISSSLFFRGYWIS